MDSTFNGLLPFSRLTDFEISEECMTTKAQIIEKMENNGFKQFIESYTPPSSENERILSSCKYYDIDQFNNLEYVKNTSSLKFIHQNIRRIARNKGEFIAFLSSLACKFDIILMSEVGNDALAYINSNLFPGYNCYVNPSTNNAYGGVAILTREELGPAKIRSDFVIEKTCTCSKCNWETLWVDVDINHISYTLAAIYRHPNGDPRHFIEGMAKVLERLPKKNICLLSGDTNIDLIKYENDHNMEYLTTLSSYNFLPYNLIPSRLTDHSATLLDHFFVRFPTNKINNKVISGNLFVDITDHLPNFLIISDTKYNYENRPFTRIFSDKNINSFNQVLMNTDWDMCLTENDPDNLCEQFYRKINSTYEQYFPLVKVSRKKSKDKPWITNGIKTSINKKNSLYKKKIQKPTRENIDRYNSYKNLLSTCMKDAETNYYKELFSDRKQSSTHFWKSLGKCLNNKRKNNRTKIHSLMINGNKITDDKRISEEMNAFFCTI